MKKRIKEYASPQLRPIVMDRVIMGDTSGAIESGGPVGGGNHTLNGAKSSSVFDSNAN